MSDDDKHDKHNNDKADNDNTGGAPKSGKEDKPSVIRSIIDIFGKAADKVPEGPLLGHVVPGWMAAHKVISTVIVAAVALPVAAVAVGALHAWYNSSFSDDYKEVLDRLAKDSALTCSLDDQSRKEDIYKQVQNDVRDSGDSSIFGIAVAPVSFIPYVGSLVPDFEWLPNKKIYDALRTAEENKMRLFRDSSLKGGLRAVIFNDGANPPVMIYKDLDGGALPEIMDVVREKGVKQHGVLGVSWNEAAQKYEAERVAVGAAEIPVMDGLSSAPMPVNSCLVDNSFTARTMGGIKGLIPDFGGDEATPEPAGQQEPAAPEKTEDDGPGFLGRAKTGFGLWGGDKKPEAPKP